MGWLFGKKKITPKVPFPEGKNFNEKALQFNRRAPSEKVFEPEQVHAAVGVNEPISTPEQAPMDEEPKTEELNKEMGANEFVPPKNPFSTAANNEPLFIKVEVYQKILNELSAIKSNISELREASKSLEHSEYNEDKNFSKLRRTTKSAHDKLLQVDKIIFKGD
ncbi:hypothetical protein HOE37_01000 [Candidatus Woesearchaeota archaeon]|jgi:hypothetical protein|nr:hypothetical protein [Candidatus Woesearchaeota archaeon]MBT4110414.1 hypothetical protein [Candidatus Woesearchaeota archaeon]MBT4336062.1 hypothetical protein [Candidatus Woesearchaeota archaeon]MBT4468959.1 hypothetical protein [Candidatus Woesearchaeota archaeon]MBT6744722.1 hypothetical protein [Candidatus Woesearchaeota archaeon]